MKLSAEIFRGPVQELSALTPEAWQIKDVAGEFRFKVTVRPPTEAYERWETRRLAARAPDIAAVQANNERAAAKLVKRELQRTAAERASREQKQRDQVVKELVVNVVQVFAGGKKVAVSEDEIVDLYRVGQPDEKRPWCDAATAELEPEDVGGEDLYRQLERKGEPLSSAMARFTSRLSNEATRQRDQRDEEQIFAPLPSTRDSGPGSGPRLATPTSSQPPSDASREAAGVPGQAATRAG